MKRISLIVLITFCVISYVAAQRYNTGIGIRAGWASGLTVKHFIGGNAALEGLLSTRYEGILITGLYEYQKPIPSISELDWFIGLGAHLGSWKTAYWAPKEYKDRYTVIGLDAIIGAEFKFPSAPFVIGLDWKPMVNLIGWSDWWGDDVALSIRYTF